MKKHTLLCYVDRTVTEHKK